MTKRTEKKFLERDYAFSLLHFCLNFLSDWMLFSRKRGPVDHSVSTFVPPPFFFLLPPPTLTQQPFLLCERICLQNSVKMVQCSKFEPILVYYKYFFVTPPLLFFLPPPPPLTQQGKCWISGGGVYMLSTPTLRSSAGPHTKYNKYKNTISTCHHYQLKHSCTHAFTCSNRRLHVIISYSSRRTHVIKLRRPI